MLSLWQVDVCHSERCRTHVERVHRLGAAAKTTDLKEEETQRSTKTMPTRLRMGGNSRQLHDSRSQ